MYSKLIFPLDPNDSVLLEIPVIISQGVSQKYRLALDDLIYVEACQHRLILHTIQGDFTTRCTFADLTVCLTPSDRFFHGGKGLLINFAHVSLVQVTGEVLLKNGQIIFCSRRRRRETREAFLVYWAKRLGKDEDIDPYNDLFCDLLEKSFQMNPMYQREGGDWLNWTVPETDCDLPIFVRQPLLLIYVFA